MIEEPVSVVVLAAGLSRRFGSRNKLTTLLRGRPLVSYAVEAALASAARNVIVVLGHEGDAVRSALQLLRSPALHFVENPDYDEGQSTSIRVGLTAVPSEDEAVIFVPGDQPGVRGASFDRLIKAWRDGRPGVVVSTHRGQRRSPTLFDRRRFSKLARLQGDQGGRSLFSDLRGDDLEVEVDSEVEIQDVDTVSDLENSL